jgi:hypothetical protein
MEILYRLYKVTLFYLVSLLFLLTFGLGLWGYFKDKIEFINNPESK